MQEGPEAVLPEPEAQQILYPPAGQRGAGDGVHLMHGLGTSRFHSALDHPHRHPAAVVIDLLAGPLRQPAGIVHLAAQAGGLRMLEEAEAADGLEVVLQGDEAVQGGPQAIAAHRQDQGLDPPVLFHQIGHAVAFPAVNRGDVLRRGERVGQGRILRRLQRVEAARIPGVAEPAGPQVHQTRGDPLVEDAPHLGGVGVRVDHPGDAQNAALLVQQRVDLLIVLQGDRRARNEHRADQTDGQRDEQGAPHGFLSLRHGARPSA